MPVRRVPWMAVFATLLAGLCIWQPSGALAGEPAVQALLDQLEDPETGKLNLEAYRKLAAEGREVLPALAERLKRPDCSAYVAVAAVQLAPKEGLELLLQGLQEGR
ncbi:MAG: hypothetical protein ACLF0G_02405 [Candidatus Brocadiia bacterium]